MRNLCKYLIHFFILTLLLFFMSASVQAGWWIFGQSQDEVDLEYLYLNKISFDESTEEITIYKESLHNGMVTIRGKARVQKGTVGLVQVTTDDKETWHPARLSEDGTFSYDFTPEPEKSYIIYVEIVDTRGKTNDVDSTRKEMILSEQNIRASVLEVLNQMLEAYIDEDPKRFMSYISEDFAGDDIALDRAIRKDFSAFTHIDLRFIPLTIATDDKGKIYVTINFNRLLTSSRSGETLSDKGTTEFIFKLAAGAPAVYSMKNPLIFGLSDASEVATGTIIPTSNDPIIVVDDRGYVTEKPFDEAIKIIIGETDSADSVEYGSNIRLKTVGHPPAGFIFADAVVDMVGSDFYVTGFTNGYTAYGFLGSGVRIKDLGLQRLNDVTEAPETGYADHTGSLGAGTIDLIEDHLYAFQLPGPKYALMYIRSVSVVMPTTVTMYMDYKYQPDGSRNF